MSVPSRTWRRFVDVYSLRKAVARHIIKPTAGVNCGKAKDKHLLHGLHHDYAKPYDVAWLCALCHAHERSIRRPPG